jgi:anti-anti-sigma factor
MLITSANSVAGRGGKMALLNPQQTVLDVLDLTGILQLIPIYSGLGSAQAAMSAG